MYLLRYLQLTLTVLFCRVLVCMAHAATAVLCYHTDTMLGCLQVQSCIVRILTNTGRGRYVQS